MRVPDPKPSDPAAAPTDTDGDWQDGDRFGRFVVTRRLGGGHAGTVYAAIDLESGGAVALKRARPGPPDAVGDSLYREAEVLRRLDHPAVPRLIEVSDGPPPCLVLEFIDGLDLERLLSSRTGPVLPADLAGLLIRLAEAVAAIHGQGILHGDLKPANVIVGPDGQPVLLDFGAARPLDSLDALPPSLSLTPGYAAPECLRADGVPGPWSDIYSLGAIGARVMTAGPGPAEAAYPPALRAAIDWALDPVPAARPQSAAEWIEALRAATAPEAEAGFPPTLRIRRRTDPATPPAPEDAAPAPARPGWRWRRARFLVPVLAGVALLGSAAWAGHGYYQRHVKREWLVATAGGDAATIAEALERARDGAIIHVRPGVYPESLVVGRPVAIVGIVEDGRRPVIRPAAGSCLRVTAPAARLSGLELRGAGRREGAADAPCLDIAGGRASVEGLTVSAPAGPAVTVRHGAEARLQDTVVAGSGAAGILLASGARAEIAGGEIRGAAGSGIVARGGAEATIAGTAITGSGRAGLLLAEGASGRLESSTISASGASGVEITGGARGVILGSRIEGSSEAGVFVADVGAAALERAQILNSGFSGVVVATTGEVRASGSVVQASGEHGVLVLDLARGVIENSRIVGNAGHGIVALSAATVDAAGNTVEGNRDPQEYDANQP